MPFSARYFSLNGFQNYFAEGAVLLAGETAKPVVEFFWNVLDLDIGHVRNDSMPVACRQDAWVGLEETEFRGLRPYIPVTRIVPSGIRTGPKLDPRSALAESC